QFGFLEDKPDPAMIYRTLRYLEKEGFVTSKWDTKGAGPAKRNYEITQEGLDLLHGWARGIEFRKQALGKFLKLYNRRFKAKK
ncbi:MAG: helix-turn-helix transcriptional regulator, partial [Deltaproteobacteria bacterium]|nr:helix-turn-helix transcriptional regulator [Deltaproteobacteria bacterium]